MDLKFYQDNGLAQLEALYDILGGAKIKSEYNGVSML